MTETWVRSISLGGEEGVELFLHCQPGAKKTEVQGIHGERLKLRLAAPPVEGKANEALISWLSKTLSIPKSRITLVSGDTGRQKRIRILGLSIEVIQARDREEGWSTASKS